MSPAVIEALARAAGLGEVNPRLSRGHQLRLGARGSVAVDTERGIWFDHERGVGGGVKALAERAGQPAPDTARTALERAQTADRLARERNARLRASARLWASSAPICGTLGETYYRAHRHIHSPLGPHLHFHATCPVRPYSPDCREAHPAVIAHVVAPDGHGLGLRITPLALDGQAREQRPEHSKHIMIGRPKGGVISLIASRNRRWVIGEGIESVLSLWDHLGDPDLGAVSALSAGGVGKFDPEVWGQPQRLLADATELIVAVDIKDKGAGHMAAEALAATCQRLGPDATLFEPPEGYGDWNDWARAHGNGDG